MKKRKKVIKAGSLVYAVISTPPMPKDPEHVRAAKSKATTQARKALNLKSAYRKLEMLLACNFTSQDLHLILTYDDLYLPSKRINAVKNVRKFLKQLRKLRKARGLELKYIYVTEGKHGDKRFHHHIIINATKRDIEDIRALWQYGSIDIEYIGDRDYVDLAKYITKESIDGKPVGAQMWTGSRNLEKPEVTTSWIDSDETLVPPVGCHIHIYNNESIYNEFGGYSYLKYRILEPRKRKTRPRQTKKQVVDIPPTLYELDMSCRTYRGF